MIKILSVEQAHRFLHNFMDTVTAILLESDTSFKAQITYVSSLKYFQSYSLHPTVAVSLCAHRVYLLGYLIG